MDALSRSWPEARQAMIRRIEAQLLKLMAIAILLGIVPSLYAQVKRPEVPKTYGVEFRYRIDAERNERIRQFKLMRDFFNKLGFEEIVTEESENADLNPEANKLMGLIPGTDAKSLLQDVRVRTVLVYPKGFQLLEDDSLVRLSIELSGGLPQNEQRRFHEQSLIVLQQLGLQESIGYDHRGFTIVRGMFPARNVRELLVDLRSEPAGWFFSTTNAAVLKPPFINYLPIRFIEVIPEPEGATPAVSQIQLVELKDLPVEFRSKISHDLKEVISKTPDKAGVFIEAFLDPVPDEDDNSWIESLRTQFPDLRYEGRLGNIASLVLSKASDGLRLSTVPLIQQIRLPRKVTPRVAVVPAPSPKKAASLDSQIRLVSNRSDLNPLSRTRLDQLHQLGHQGRGIHLVIIDTDFAGLARFYDRGLSAKDTVYIDLTAERSLEILPDPEPVDGLGSGTLSALSAAAAAPKAHLTLVRVNQDSPIQLETVTKAVMNRSYRSESMVQRRREFDAQLIVLHQKIEAANARYRKAIDNFEDTEEVRQERLDSIKELNKVRLEESEFLAKATRLARLEDGLLELRNAQIIINNLTWDTGHAIDGNSVLSQYLTKTLTMAQPSFVYNQWKQPKKPTWVQAAGDTGGQSWTGQFLDRDGNGVMEFTNSNTTLPDRWNTELNFLCFEHDEMGSADLPKNRKIRLAMQWREPHSEDFPANEFRTPISKLRLQLLYQRDAQGEKLPSDELNLVAQADSAGTLLYAESHFGIYEQVIEVTLPATGRYAVRVEGKAPEFSLPRGVAGLPALQESIELNPRLVVESIDEQLSPGRLVFGDYRVPGGVGMPADSRSILTVGAASLDLKTRLSTSRGAGPATQLLDKPDVWAFDTLPLPGVEPVQSGFGTSAAAGFAGGLAASVRSANGSSRYLMSSLGLQSGHLLELPQEWIDLKKR
jgi:hypothetical protein